MKRKIVLAAGALTLTGSIFLLLQSGGNLPSSSAHSSQMDETRSENSTEPAIHHHDSPNKKDPSTAGNFDERARQILMMPMEGPREEAIRTLAQEWADADSTAAERWAMSLDVPEEREQALTHICRQSATLHPLRAIEIARTHELHEGLIHAAAHLWAGSDADAATQWATTLPDGDLKDRVDLQILLVRADSDPSSAAARLTSLYPSGTMLEEATIAVLHRWLRQDADEAREWVSTFAEGELKDRAMGEIRGMIAIHPSSEND